MQPDHDRTLEQQDQPDADRAVPDADRAQTRTATGGDDLSGPDLAPTTATRRVTAQEAADALGITVEAVRARIRRGTLTKEKGSDGTVYVRLSTEQTQQMHDRSAEHSRVEDAFTSGVRGERDRTGDRSRPNDAIVEALKEQIEMLRSEIEDRKEEARRKDAIIMSLSQRFPELPSTSSRGAPGMATEAQEEESQAGEGQEAPRRRSWLMRFFFGP